MIDLHMHTIYSDGSNTVKDILRMCEAKKIKCISITDHDTCKQYEDEAIRNNKYFSGKIIKGAELRASFENRRIEILAYNINPEVLNKWLEKYYTPEKIREKQKMIYEELLKIFDEQGIVYNKDDIPKPKVTEFIEKLIYKEAIKHKENSQLIEEFTETYRNFFRNGIANPQSRYYLKPYGVPEYKEVIESIHEAGGKAFLAHPYEYQIDDTIAFIDRLMKETKLDGIECFHPSSEREGRSNMLIEYAKNNNLYISGGSDYHGDVKPDIELGIGRGTLNISEEIIKEWSY